MRVVAPCGALTGMGSSIRPLRAAELHALVRRDLRRHGEVEAPAVAEVDQRAGQAVGAERRVAVDERDAARRLGLEEEAPGDDGVAADVVEAAAADVGLVADVGRVDVDVAEEHLHGAQRADAPLRAPARARAATAGGSAP